MLETPAPTKGTADFSRFVALGNSLTAGYADGALYRKGQEVAFAKLIAERMQMTGGWQPRYGEMPDDPSNPLDADRGLGITRLPNGNVMISSKFVLRAGRDCKGVGSIGPARLAPDVPQSQEPFFFRFLGNKQLDTANAPLNLIGVPGMKAVEAGFVGYGNPANSVGIFNPFFTRIARNPVTSSALGDAAAARPTFFSLFLGNNDVLLYAVAGGADPLNPITPVPLFEQAIDGLVNVLTANGAKGVIGTVPDIATTPHFTTIPYNGLTLDTTSAAQLNVGYAIPIQLGLVKRFKVGNNPFVIEQPRTPSNPAGLRSATAKDYMVLSTPLDSVKCFGLGSMVPMRNQYVLDSTEAAVVAIATNAYNAKIRQVAAAKNLALADANALLRQLKNEGVQRFDGATISSALATGNGFSLDGLHLTPRGNAYLANCFINAINATYGSTLPTYSLSDFPGSVFP